MNDDNNVVRYRVELDIPDSSGKTRVFESAINRVSGALETNLVNASSKAKSALDSTFDTTKIERYNQASRIAATQQNELDRLRIANLNAIQQKREADAFNAAANADRVRKAEHNAMVALTRAEESRAATRRSMQEREAVYMRTRAAEVKKIQDETTRQANQQEVLRTHVAREQGEARARINRTLARQQSDDTIREARRVAAATGSGGSSGGSGGLGGNILSAMGFAGGAGAIAGVLIANTVQNITRHVREGISAWFQYSAHIEQVKIGFTSMLGSGQAAQGLINDLERMARLTPFEFGGLADASRRLLALGTAAKDVLPIMTAIGNAVSAAGGSNDQLQRVVYAFGDIQAKGKLTGEEIRQLANNGIPVFKILQEQLHLTNAEIFKMVRGSKLGSEEFIEAFKRFSAEKFGDAMAAQSKTALGALSNIHDAVLQIADKAMKPLFEQMSSGLSGIADSLISNQDQWISWGSSVTGTIASTISIITGLIMKIKDVDQALSERSGWSNISGQLDQQFQKQAQDNSSASVAGMMLLAYLGIDMSSGKKPGSSKPITSLPGIFDVTGVGDMLKQPGYRQFGPDKKSEQESADLAKKVQKMYADLLVDAQFFGDRSKVAEFKRKLMSAGVTDFASGDAKSILDVAREMDAKTAGMKAAREALKPTPWTLPAMVEFARSQGMEVISTTGGRHNKGSAHFDARAMDIRTRDRNPLDVARFMENAEQAGLRVFDERIRPAGQEVWGGPHLHLSFKRGDKRRGPGFAGPGDGGLGPEDPQDVNNRLFLSAMTLIAQRRQLTDAISTGSDGIIEELIPTEIYGRKSKGQMRFDDMAKASNERRDNFLFDSANLDGILELVKSDAFVDRLQRIQDYTIEATKAEADYGNMIAENADKAAVADRRRNQVAQERLDLGRSIQQLEDDIANAGANSALVHEHAWLSAIRNVQEANEEAAISMIHSQVKIADASVFNADRARAAIMDHVASAGGYTEIFSDAVTSAMDAVGDGVSKLLGHVNKGMGAFGDILTQIEASLIRMVMNRMIMKLVDMFLPASGGGGGVMAGGGSTPAMGGSGIGAILGKIPGLFGINLGGGGNGGGKGGNGSIFDTSFGGGDGSSLFGSAASFAGSTISGGASNASALQALGGLGAAAGAAAGTGKLSGIGGSLVSALPLLGLSMGASLGGGLFKDSRLASGIGTIAGGALGLAGGLAGFTALGGSIAGTFGTGILGSAAGAIAGALPIIAPIAIAGLVAAYFINRSALRRKEETIRNDEILGAFSALDQIKKLVETHKMDGAEGVVQALSVRQRYLDNMNQLRDSKTRRHALADVSRLDLRINEIKKVANVALNDNKRDDLLVPEFATRGTVPGPFGAPRLVLAHGGEHFLGLNASNHALNGGDSGVTAGGGGVGGGNVTLNVELSLGTDTQDKLFVNGAESDAGLKVLGKRIKDLKKYLEA